MFFKNNLIFILSSILFLNVTRAQQDVPRIISYQGVLVGSDGKPVNDIKNLTITIVDNSGTPHSSGFIHTESFILQGGLFFARLGAPPHSSVQFPILDGQWNLKISDGNPSNDRLVPLYSTVSALNIADNVVTSQKIKDGEVDLQDLAPGNTPGEILKWDGIQWVRGQDEGLRSVTVEQPIEGDGTSTDPLRVTIPSSVPIGTIVSYYGNENQLNSEWLICDGSTVDTTYPLLRQHLIALNGTVILPDLRGRFLRGNDSTTIKGRANNDPDYNLRTGTNKIGSIQSDELGRHKHVGIWGPKSDVDGGGTRWAAGSRDNNIDSIRSSGSIDSYTGDYNGSETRPKNVAVNWIIKAK